ncbi:metallophosphoesterase family protein [bacterium]|nr:metallophosphoesterase family protein [bacterium]
MSPIPPSHFYGLEPPLVVLSDLHLGHPASFIRDPAEVMPLLGSAKTAIFNGDTFEQLHFGRRDRAKQMLRRLMELCSDRGVQPILLSGNHDPMASSLHYLDLFDGKVLLTHGDILHEAVAPWSREAPAVLGERKRLLKTRPFEAELDDQTLLHKQSEMVAALYDHDVAQGLAAQGYMIGKFLAKPWRVFIALHYWSRAVHYARVFVQRYRPAARLFLFGHTHRPGVWSQKDLTVVNTGSFCPLSHPLVIHLDDQRAVVHRARFDRHVYHLGDELHRVIFR